MNDIAKQDASLDDVERTMGDREIAAGSVHRGPPPTVRRYDAPVQDVGDATAPERIDCFFLPASGELRVDGIWCWSATPAGEILAREAPSQLRLQWTPPNDRDIATGWRSDWSRTGQRHLARARARLRRGGIAKRSGHGLLRRGHEMGGPLRLLGDYLPDRPTPEWFTFDEAEEIQLVD